VTSRADADVRRAPRPNGPVELRLALTSFAVAVLAAVPVLAVAWWAAGGLGLRGATFGAGVVAGGYLVSAGLQALVRPLGAMAALAATVAGYVLRLLLYAVLLVVLSPVEGFSRPALAVSTAVLVVVTLSHEVWLIGRTRHFSWIDPTAGRPAHRPERTAG